MPIIDGKVHRSRFTSLKLGELSSVDNPAQIGARMAIMKRDFNAKDRQRLADSGAALPDGSYPIETVGDLGNAVQAFGRAKNPGKVKSHIVSRARALDALDKLPEDWNVKKFADVVEIAKYIGDGDEGAQSFQDVLAENKFDQNVWPCVDALSQSIRSVVGDSSLTGGERDAQINTSVQQFLQSVRDISPEVSKQLEPLLVRKRDDQMAKTVEELQTDVTKLEGQVNDLTAKLDVAEKAKAKAMQDAEDAAEQCKTTKAALEEAKKSGGELATVKAELETTKAALVAASEETLKVGDVEVKKSEFGATQFAVLKAERDEKLTTQLEKRAIDEFPHVVGTPTEKALVLKTVAGLKEDDPTRKALEAVLTSAEKMVASGFARIGGGGGVTPTEKVAQQTFKQKVAEIRKRDEITEHAAMTKARTEFPAEYAAAYPDSAPAEQSAN